MLICNGLDSNSRFVAIRKDAHFHRVQQSPDSCGDSPLRQTTCRVSFVN